MRVKSHVRHIMKQVSLGERRPAGGAVMKEKEADTMVEIEGH
jgi:hypothetical protein